MTEHWRSADFVSAAHAWIDARLPELGLVRTGEVEQPHVYPWSTVMRVPTGAGPVWFKANHQPLRHEAALTALLARRSAGLVPAPLALDQETGWLLMADAGDRLRDLAPADALGRWHDVLPAYAELQLACEADVPALLALGVPDRRLPTLADSYAALLAELPGTDARLPGRSRVEELCGELAAFGVPETVQHDDLHDAQVFLRDGHPQVLDWGDACVSHPFFTLSVVLEGVVQWGVDDEPGSEDLAPYVASYLAPYRERHAGDLDEAVRLALRLGWVCRAVNGHLPGDPDATRTRLRMFLDGRP
ncbi:aminoglycoside phosphotransferase family protein [Nocardioides coralli]|uniref:aminoglycoside phosphotransferase family protein n=1 Tax=Nocardioides coralli TaxID=2872154 RepID=UPI001CA3DD4D|nr:aminoglycoside phosphotransferase family protein [Nocardioides coralli]QZY28598.1 aminoglycoside phosphotransferase family protein [Nocardioides coralli]